MNEREATTTAIRAVIESEAILNLHQYPIDVDVRDGALVIAGEVPDIVAKRRIPKLAAGLSGGADIIDRLQVIPSERRGDGAVLNSMYEALVQESAFHGHTILAHMDAAPAVRAASRDDWTGVIEISVHDAVVSIVGHVPSLTHKRLADVLAWWTVGSVDVDNKLHIVPPEQDNDDEITDALRIVLEKDPWLDPGQIVVRTHDKCVTLEGLVHSREQRHMAECNAWCVLGVHEVINHIEVRP